MSSHMNGRNTGGTTTARRRGWWHWCVAGAWLASALTGRAQWLSQTNELRAGWNAVYLHVDASHATLDELVGNHPANKVEEIWLWAPEPSAAQFVTSPQSPAQPTHWLQWVRTGSPSASLTRISGNVACLVRASEDYAWVVQGKPVAPRHTWSGSGLNFVGFPTLPGAAAPTFDAFFGPVPDLRHNAEVYGYVGGAVQDNPVPLLDFQTSRPIRGQAFWVRAPQGARYLGPFEVVFPTSSGARFGEGSGQVSFRLRNATASELTVTLEGVSSQTPPAGQPAIQGPVPILVRGDYQAGTFEFSHAALAEGPRSWTLKPAGEPGSDIEVVLGASRPAMTGAPGTLYASVLRFTDGLNHTRIDVPTSATVGSSAGLWVGSASVTAVSQYLKTYAKASSEGDKNAVLARLGLAEGVDGYHYELDPATGRILVHGGPPPARTGSYLVDGPIRTDTSTVPRAFPLRLIVHHDGTGTRMFQKIFYGVGAGNQAVLATRESLLDASKKSDARRISAVHLPTSGTNAGWAMTGEFRPGTNVTATVETLFDDHSSSPFLHTYHPDHDNLDAQYAGALPRGVESYGIRRSIRLELTPPASDFESLTRGGSALNGEYSETVTVLGGAGASREYTVRGAFVLNRISDIASVTTN